MADDALVDLIRRIERSMRCQCVALVALVSLVVVAQALVLVLVFSKCAESRGPVIQANPVNSNDIEITGESAAIQERARLRGYFTKAEFAELLGVSVRTLERRIEDGEVSPGPRKDESGRVLIDLDATMTRQ